MVSEGLLSPGWEERPVEPREPGWRVFPELGGSGGSSAWSCVVLPVPCGPAWFYLVLRGSTWSCVVLPAPCGPAWSRVVPPGPACPVWSCVGACGPGDSL